MMKSCFVVAAAVLALAACGGGGGSGGGDGGAGGIAAGGSGGGSAGTGGTPGTGGSGGSAGSAGDGGSGGAGGDGGTAGQGGDGGAGGSGGTPASKAVVGKVVDYSGAPIAGVMVAIDGRYDDFLITGVDGAFRFEGVDGSYSLTVSWADNVIFHFEGLKRRNPVVPLAEAFVFSKQTTVAGEVASDDPDLFPLGGVKNILISFSGQTGSPLRTDSDGAFDGEWSWFDSRPAIQADAVAVLLEVDGDGNLRVFDMGRLPRQTLEADGELTDLEIRLGAGPLPVGSTTFSLVPGAYSTDFDVRLGSFQAMGARFLMFTTLAVADGDSLELPATGTEIFVTGEDVNGTAAAIKVPAVIGGTTKLELPANPILKAVTPVHGATGVASPVTLGWTPVAGANTYLVQVDEVGGKTRRFVLPGSTSSLKIVDVGVLGGAIGPGRTVNWSVDAILGPVMSPDDLTDGSGAGVFRMYNDPDFRAFYSTSTSAFTTAP